MNRKIGIEPIGPTHVHFFVPPIGCSLLFWVFFSFLVRFDLRVIIVATLLNFKIPCPFIVKFNYKYRYSHIEYHIIDLNWQIL